MFIAIEGTDASGKSSLCVEIAKQMSTHTTYHKGKPERETRDWALNEYVFSVNDLDFFEVDAVADRWHWGEVTYAPLKRPHTCIDDYGLLGVAGWRWVEMYMAAKGMCQFVLHQPLEVVTQRLKMRGDDYVLASELAQILSLYDKAAKSTHTLCGRLSPSSHSLDAVSNLAAKVITRAREAIAATAHLQPYSTYIGAAEPQYLIVSSSPDSHLPLVPSTHSANDAYIASIPEEMWRSIGIVNVHSMTATQFSNMMYALKSPRIVLHNDALEELPALLYVPTSVIVSADVMLDTEKNRR